MTEEKVMYFAHPVNTYNTHLETTLIKIIQAHFPDWRIENPNQPKHQEGYQRWLKEQGNGMLYYFNEVLANVQGVTGLPFPDGRIGAGVFGEMDFVFKRKSRVWTIDYEGVLDQVADISVLKSLALTPEETRPRIYIGGKRENGMKGFFD